MGLVRGIARKTLFYAGGPAVIRAWRRWTGERRVTILMYHKVDDHSPPLFGRAVLPEVFERQIRFLKRFYRVADLSELSDPEALGSGDREAVVLTFDDGYRSNYLKAFPILKKYGVPATIFLATDYIDTPRMLPHDQLSWILYNARETPRPEAFRGEGIPSGAADDVADFSRSGEGRLKSLFSLEDRLKRLPRPVRNCALEWLAGLCKVASWKESPEPVMLSWNEVREMAGNGISFGSHTRSHPVLSALSLSEIRLEISESKERIESEIQKAVTAFAYPYGKPEDYPPKMISLLRQEGYRLACGTTVGVERFPILSPYELKRRGGPMTPSLFI